MEGKKALLIRDAPYSDQIIVLVLKYGFAVIDKNTKIIEPVAIIQLTNGELTSVNVNNLKVLENELNIQRPNRFETMEDVFDYVCTKLNAKRSFVKSDSRNPDHVVVRKIFCAYCDYAGFLRIKGRLVSKLMEKCAEIIDKKRLLVYHNVNKFAEILKFDQEIYEIVRKNFPELINY